MMLSLLTSPQVNYPTRMARSGFEQGSRPKMPEDGLSVQLPYGGWTSTVTLSLLTSLQVHYPTRKARIGIKPGIRPKMGGLCNFSTGGGLSL